MSTPKLSTEELETNIKKSASAVAVLGIFSVLNMYILYKSVTKEINPNNPSFAFYEMLKQSSIIFLVTQLYGMTTLSNNGAYLQKNEKIIFPILVGIVIYILNVFMGYAQMSKCKKPNRRYTLFFPLFPMAMVVSLYFAVSTFEWMRAPFDNLLGGTQTVWSYWFAIGFWLACGIWPSLSYTYFTLQRYACTTSSEINIKIPKQS
jgi:hypothetical protein